MYRFRSIENLLGKYLELENQEIYFASPEELNDPMEGYKDIFWKGDEIVWKNLFINYIHCLEHIFNLTILLNENEKITNNDIPIFRKFSNGNTTKAKELIVNDILELFFNSQFINSFPKSLEQRNNPIRISEFLSILKLIHPFALDSISKVYYKKEFITKPFLSESNKVFIEEAEKIGNFIEVLNNIENENPESKNVLEKFFEQINLKSKEVDLISKLNYSNAELASNKFFLLTEFPENFISKLESLMYPNWYSASFLRDCKNSAIWGYYGDNHKGVCLQFKVNNDNEKKTLNLNTEYGYNSEPVIGMKPHTFREIEYHNKHSEIDFFRTIGRMSKIELNHLWYSNENGDTSICAEHLNENNEEWVDKYWENFYKSISIKLSEWKYEKESRLIITNNFIDYSDKNTRKLKYDFNDLDGIIFGVKTKTSDKIRILKIIEEKCKKHNRKEFNFYQAYYSKDSGKIENVKLELINLE
jgi:hypothetical protein